MKLFQGNDPHKQLIAFRNGSGSALEYFFHRHNVHVRYYLLSVVRNRTVAEELTQKAFLTLYYNRSQIENPVHLLAFLYHIARKCARLYLQGSSCTNDYGAIIVPPASELMAIFDDVEVSRIEDLAEAILVINGLSPRRKIVMEMRVFLRMEVQEIARHLERKPKTIWNQIAQSKRILRRRLGPDFDPELLFL